MKNQPIGVLDSGWGGLSITKELIRILPNESIIYFADSKNCPYGTKSLIEIRKITTKVIDFLVSKNCKLIVIACNSITSVLIEELRQQYKVPFVGVEPATLVAARETKSGKIGVLATKTTATSKLFNQTKGKITARVEVEVEIGKGLVELVEEGKIKGKKVEKVVLLNLANFKNTGVDQVVLGCTHYPFLIKVMRKIAPEMNFIDPSSAVALQVKRVLAEKKLLKKKDNHFYDVYFSKKAGGMKILLEKSKLIQIRKKEMLVL